LSDVVVEFETYRNETRGKLGMTMGHFLTQLRQRYDAGQISAGDVYHSVCLLIEVFNNELGE
jgi:hypothetical protein